LKEIVTLLRCIGKDPDVEAQPDVHAHVIGPAARETKGELPMSFWPLMSIVNTNALHAASLASLPERENEERKT
jgi:hypothetical protein